MILDSSFRRADNKGFAINADRIEVGGSWRIEETTLAGSVRAVASKVDGDIYLSGVSAMPDRAEAVVDLHRVTASNVYLKGVNGEGIISISDARLHGSFVIGPAKDAQFSPPGWILSASGVTVAGDMSIGYLISENDSVVTIFVDGGGSGSFQDPEVKASLSLIREVGNNAGSIDLEGATVARRLEIWGAGGRVDLAGCKVGTLCLPQSELLVPQLISAEGIRLDDLDSPALLVRSSLSRWLSSSESGQPYRAFSEVLERKGMRTESKRLLYDGALLTSKRSPLGPARVGRFLGRILVGAGYYPIRALYSLVAVFALTAALAYSFSDDFSVSVRVAEVSPESGERSVLANSECSKDWAIPCFDPLLFAATNTLPAAGPAQAFQAPSGWFTATCALLRVVSWILTALLLAGFTGLLRRQS